MSKSRGNSYTGDQLLEEKGYHPDQIRHFLSILSLSEKNSNLDFEHLERRNSFLAGPLNAALENPSPPAIPNLADKFPQANSWIKFPKKPQK